MSKAFFVGGAKSAMRQIGALRTFVRGRPLPGRIEVFDSSGSELGGIVKEHFSDSRLTALSGWKTGPIPTANAYGVDEERTSVTFFRFGGAHQSSRYIVMQTSVDVLLSLEAFSPKKDTGIGAAFQEHIGAGYGDGGTVAEHRYSIPTIPKPIVLSPQGRSFFKDMLVRDARYVDHFHEATLAFQFETQEDGTFWYLALSANAPIDRCRIYFLLPDAKGDALFLLLGSPLRESRKKDQQLIDTWKTLPFPPFPAPGRLGSVLKVSPYEAPALQASLSSEHRYRVGGGEDGFGTIRAFYPKQE